MIKVQKVVKRFGATVAADSVSFEVDKGEILGFLGPNGAGKSTVMRMITTYLVPDSGTVTVGDHDVITHPQEVRRQLGYLPENVPLYNDMRVLDFLRFVAEARGFRGKEIRERVDRSIDQVRLQSMMKKSCGDLSKGFRQRVGLAMTLIHDPPFLILDEPTGGLDPHQIIEVRQLIQDIGKDRAIIFSTHILQEIAAICSRIIIIKNGRLIANGTTEDLRTQAGNVMMVEARIRAPESVIREKLSNLPGLNISYDSDGFAQVQCQAGANGDSGVKVFEAAKENGWELAELRRNLISLEDVYLTLTAD